MSWIPNDKECGFSAGIVVAGFSEGPTRPTKNFIYLSTLQFNCWKYFVPMKRLSDNERPTIGRIINHI